MVKIVTSIPLRRGRWNVVDYPDKEKEKTSSKPENPVPPVQVPVQPVVQPLPQTVIPQQPQVQPLPTATQTVAQSDLVIAKSETDSIQQPQQPNFVGATTVLSTAGGLPAAVDPNHRVSQMNTVRTVPNNLHNLGAMPAQTSHSAADPAMNVVVTTHHTYTASQVIKN